MAKSVLITGASSGIGKALAYELAGRGYGLALTARRLDRLTEIQADLNRLNPGGAVVVERLDVTEYDVIPQVIGKLGEALGELNIVIANAGIATGERIGTGQFDKVRQIVETNLLGAMATADAAAGYFQKRDGGHIVGISSVSAFRGLPRSAGYCASKAGLAVYLEALRAELYRRKIDVTVIYPGFIDTPLNRKLPNRPFVISSERCASMIARMIERKVRSSTIPRWPWCIVGRLMKILPTGVIAKV